MKTNHYYNVLVHVKKNVRFETAKGSHRCTTGRHPRHMWMIVTWGHAAAVFASCYHVGLLRTADTTRWLDLEAIKKMRTVSRMLGVHVWASICIVHSTENAKPYVTIHQPWHHWGMWHFSLSRILRSNLVPWHDPKQSYILRVLRVCHKTFFTSYTMWLPFAHRRSPHRCCTSSRPFHKGLPCIQSMDHQ